MPSPRFLRAGLCAALALPAVPAEALKINLVDGGGARRGTQGYVGLVAARRYWESVIGSDVTVNVNVGFRPLAGSTLGTTFSQTITTTPALAKQAMIAAATSPLDGIAVANLPQVTSARFRLNTSVARALGFATTAPSDASITFNSAAAFDFDARDGIVGGTVDFIGAAVHEMGHALGFTSNVGLTVPLNTDMFRYTAPGAWSFAWGADAYFSVDGGASQLFGNSRLATGADGDQPSHWKDGGRTVDALGCTVLLEPQVGIMDPTAGYCQEAVVTAQDLAAFDVLGWTLRRNILAEPGYRVTSGQIRSAFAPVPEPAAWATMAVGFGVAGVALRRRRRIAA